MKLIAIKNKRYILRLALIAVPLLPVLSSCEDDFLEAVPELEISDVNAFDTPERVLAQVNGLYSGLKHGRFLGGRYQIYNDIRAEEFINRTGNNVTGTSVWNATAGADETYITDIWSRGYQAINRVNVFLKGLEDNAAKVGAEDAQSYGAEAKFIRAMSYLSLVQVFAKPYTSDNGASPGLPLRLQAETTGANNSLERSSVAEVYAQILSDLNEAEAGLPESYGDPVLNTTRATKSAAIALKTRVYLIMGRYQDVVTEGNKLVPNAAPFASALALQHKLEEDVIAVFSNYTNSEAIFSVPFTATDAPGTQNQLGYYFNSGNTEYYLNQSAPGIFANPQFEADDARRTELTATINGQQYVTKFSGVNPYIDWVPLIRYAEVLLNLAEAEAEVGSEERAVALLEAVHQRSDASWQYTGTGQEDLVAAILTERRIELITEGFRANDILRRSLPLYSAGAGVSIAPSDERYVFSIPTSELNTNSGL
ncbi:RagB/SusD family nutrient uptake outer membrane protein [Pontibacter korlensis]|uniref:Carbohydrate-binding protein SusD n=1 Tax=Pontibacter korlensis TaxID=400092 RepID=A0A0E3ZDV8_9BACT|nr:RagB/SusD family nutrient uptake outer membrane protein [Pontibacter korlensis]AKD03400.1 carbohydrate-binding protein SusD [Pontibacter korlensis]